MERVFDFNPAYVLAEVTLAFSYTPRILQNRIAHRPHTGLLYVVCGSYTYTWEGGSFCAQAGSVIYLPPDSITYTYSIADGTKTVQIEFDLICTETKIALAYATHPVLLLSEAAHLKGAFDAVVADFVKKDLSSKLQMYADLYTLLAACAKATETARPTCSRLAPALSYLQENYTKPINVEMLASLCHLSPSQLRRLFRTTLGTTPIVYKNALVLADAKKLLLNMELSIGEIADLLGFYDVYAFSHFFSAAQGCSPSAYRKGVDKAEKA